jgi:hypothetical protein
MANYTFPTLPGSYAVGDTVTFNYSGAVQTFTTSNITTMKIELYGARGGYVGDTPGSGGYTYGNYSTTSGTTLYFYCGGIGGNAGGAGFGTAFASRAGFNGGGECGYGSSSNYGWHYGSGGGGATDVRLGGTALSNRILIAGGGGGSGTRNVQLTGRADGGAGGGGGFMSQNGNTGYTSSARGPGTGGTQSSAGTGGAFSDIAACGTAGFAGSLGVGGQGGNDTMIIVYNYAGGGGGGGYYGGGGGGAGGYDGRGNGSGGGGSGYINQTHITRFGGESGTNFGYGYARITVLS